MKGLMTASVAALALAGTVLAGDVTVNYDKTAAFGAVKTFALKLETSWGNPIGEKKLTDLKWKSATTDWGQVRVNQNADGGSLRINGQAVAYGIGTHANSVIAFDLPEGFTRFKARGGLYNGGTDQAGGGASSAQFLVYTQQPPSFAAQNAGGGGSASGHDPSDAVAGLEPGLGPGPQRC